MTITDKANPDTSNLLLLSHEALCRCFILTHNSHFSAGTTLIWRCVYISSESTWDQEIDQLGKVVESIPKKPNCSTVTGFTEWVWMFLSTEVSMGNCTGIHWKYIILLQIYNTQQSLWILSVLLKQSSSELSWLGFWKLRQLEVGVDKPLGGFWNHITLAQTGWPVALDDTPGAP